MEIKDWLVLIATLLSPLVALQVSKLIEEFKESKQRKLDIFKTLMATRKERLSQRHVEALNMIDIEFSKNNKLESEVRTAWKIYLDHLSGSNIMSPENWANQGTELFVKLLHKMSISLDYDFDEVHIKRSIYSPRFHEENEETILAIRNMLAELLSGRTSLKMSVIDFPHAEYEPLDEQQRKLIELLIKQLTGKEPLKVEVVKDV